MNRTEVQIAMEALERQREMAFSHKEVEDIDKEIHRLKALEKELSR